MDFTEAVQTGLTKYFVFRGRAARSEYWYFVLFCALVRVVSVIGDFVIFQFVGPTRIGLHTLTALLLLIPQMAVLVRRLHDTEHSAWVVLGLIVLAMVDFLIFESYLTSDSTLPIKLAVSAVGMVSVVLFIVQFVWLVTPGTEGDNEYGADPLASLGQQAN